MLKKSFPPDYGQLCLEIILQIRKTNVEEVYLTAGEIYLPLQTDHIACLTTEKFSF